MKITILGCGGSFGSPLAWQRHGNIDLNNKKNFRTRSSILIDIDNKKILIDTSPDLRNQLYEAKCTNIDAVFYTHMHSDHTSGLPDMRAMSLINKKIIPAYMPTEMISEMESMYKYIFKGEKDYRPFMEIKELLKHTSPIILKLKYHYNRPRPEQLAKEMGLKFHSEPLDSARTPSYPSGHAAQGRFIGRYLSDMYPKHENELMKLGNEIGTGRLVAKVHYPSDDLFGKEVGDVLYKTMGKKLVKENVDVGADGFVTTDTNPYFTNYITPKVKQKLFKYWDSLGKADYDSLKLFGVEEDGFGDAPYGSDFHNVGDVLYPVLALEWIGGVDNTEFAKSGWKSTDEMGFQDLKFKVEPIGYDYMFDESANFGEQGYSCWDIRVLIDVNETASLDDSDRLKELFPESAQNKVSRYNNYTNEQMEIIEELWYYYEEEASEYFRQFCNVEVRLV